MSKKKTNPPSTKTKLHPNNKHRANYDFPKLTASFPALAPFVQINKYNNESINFFDPVAVKMLNTALLIHFYGIDTWDIPKGYLCPPIPGRADYIHYIADLLGQSNKGKIPKGPAIKCLDIGVGASCIYPIIGTQEYGWLFSGTDVDEVAMTSAQKIIDDNPVLQEKIDIRRQPDPKYMFRSVIKKDEYFDVAICNPPFHSSLEEAQSASLRKLNNLTRKKHQKPVLNFGGQQNELWYEGGEREFIKRMIYESKHYSTDCFWFSSLVSKESNLSFVATILRTVDAKEVKVIPMGQGHKQSRIIAWTYLTPKQQKIWMESKEY